MGERVQDEDRLDVRLLGLVGAQELAAGGHVEEEVAHLDRGPGGHADLAHVLQAAARDDQFGAGLGGDWFELAGKHADDLSELLEPMFLLNGMLKEDVEKSGERWFSPAEEARLVADIQENLPVIVQTIYNFWRNKRTGGTVRQEEPKAGRNDPCPCGSGRKFKQCCGRPDKLN